MEHLSGLVGKQCLCWHRLQKALTSLGICSVLEKTWKSRATKRRGKYRIILSGAWGRWMISHTALVACKKPKQPDTTQH